MITAKEFFERYPLYKKCPAEGILEVDQEFAKKIALTSTMGSGRSVGFSNRYILLHPPINDVCPICKSTQTYNMIGEYGDDGFNYVGKIFTANYVCSSCKSDLKIFFFRFHQSSNVNKAQKSNMCVQKVGQFPAWSIEPEESIQKMLGNHGDYFGKGLVCESQGYGIGAYGYFRRITEEIIDELLDSIEDLLEGEDKTKYLDALAKTKKTRVAQEKINLVKDLLPLSLRSGNINPLDTLHSALSEGLHAEDDESCLEYVNEIKEVLIYLISQTIKKKEETKTFTDSMRRLLEKKASRS